MVTIIVLIVYIIGVCIAHNRIMAWRIEGIIMKTTDCKNLFLISLLSWLSLILYGVVKLLNDSEEN